jgi:hypothetical protein
MELLPLMRMTTMMDLCPDLVVVTGTITVL